MKTNKQKILIQIIDYLNDNFGLTQKSLVKPNGINPYSKDFDSIEELDAYYKQWAKQRLQKLIKQNKSILTEIDYLVSHIIF